MNTLKELVYILEQNKSTYLQSWLFQNNTTNLVRLYYGLLNDTFKDDDEASIALYGKAGAAAFHKLKFDFKSQLYDLIPFINLKIKNKNDAEEERFRYHNLIMSFNVLLNLSGDGAAIEMGEYIFDNCIKYGFTDLAYTVAKRILGKINNQKKQAFYASEAKRLHTIEGIELEAKTYYDEILLLYRNDKLSDEELVAFTIQKRDAFQNIKGAYSSPAIATYAYLFDICVHSARHDATATFKTALEAATYFEQLPIRHAQPLKAYYTYLIVGYTQRKEFEIAAEYIEKSLKCVNEGTASWLKTLELGFVSYLHSGNYSTAVDIYIKASNNNFLKSFPVHIQEKWVIYHAFLHFLIQSGAYQLNEKQKTKFKNEFKLGRFKSELNFYDKEKSGMNLNILLIEILILIVAKNHDTLIDRYEAIQKYVQRYIPDTAPKSRIRLIFKLLLLCIKHNFKREKVEQVAQPIFEALAIQSAELGDEAYELEILPYEKVGSLILETMEKK
jgi:hypothetical protein